MVKQLITSLILIFVLVSPNFANVISVEKIAIKGNPGNDLAGYWNSLTDVKEVDIITTDASLLYKGSKNNFTLFRLSFDIDVASASTLDLHAGLDAGYGAEIFVNEQLLGNRDGNTWWRRNFNHKHVININNASLKNGRNQISVYWAEYVNSGGNSFEFSINDGLRTALSSQNIQQATAVSENASFLGLTSLLLLLVSRFVTKRV